MLPALAQALSGLSGALYGLGAAGLARSISQVLQNWTINVTFIQGFSVGLLFLGAIALNARKERFWCRYLCPAGALLGLLSRWNLLKLKIDDEKCIKCGLCTQHCETQAHPYPNDQWKSGECIYCENCASICPTAAIGFRLSARPEKLTNVSNVDLSRRKLILTTLLGLVAAPFFRLTPSRKRASLKLIRPPGALPEPKFLAKCVKCGQCMKACPTGGLQPALTEAGPGGDLDADARAQDRLLRVLLLALHPGLPDRGHPEADDRGEEQGQDRHGLGQQEPLHPLRPGQALHRLRGALPASRPRPSSSSRSRPSSPTARSAVQKAPVIDLELCIGCGICENKCPVMDDPAIFVTSVGETRSETNRLLLDISGGTASESRTNKAARGGSTSGSDRPSSSSSVSFGTTSKRSPTMP